jgi:hypothetical protein
LEEGLLGDHHDDDADGDDGRASNQGSRTTPTDLSAARKDGEIMMHTVPSTDLAEGNTDLSLLPQVTCDEEPRDGT